MAQHTEDMSQVPDQNTNPADEWFHVRVTKVEEGVSTTQNPIVKLQMKIQNEGPNIGRMVFANPSLQAHALFTLKAFYTAAGYKPAAGQGHDPMNLMDTEFWIFPESKIVDGETRIDIKPYNIRSIQEGPGKAKATAK